MRLLEEVEEGGRREGVAVELDLDRQLLSAGVHGEGGAPPRVRHLFISGRMSCEMRFN